MTWHCLAKTAMQDSTELPPELMARIFSACLPPTQDAFPHADTAPMLLCRVCRRWRSIALSTPELWATFVAKDGKASVETLKLWSDRSGSLPLTYVLDSNVIDTGKILLETATAYKQRWGTLILHLCDQSFAPLNSISSCRLPLLRSLELKARWRREGHGMTAPDPRRLPTFDLGGAPNLTELRLTSYPRNHLTGIPWHRLTVLKLEGRVVRRDMERLALCRALVDLTLSYPGSGPIIQPALNMVPELVHLPQLQSLTTDASEILTCLRLPRLRHLDLEVFGNEDPLNLLSALRDWACTLRSLTVTRPSPGVPLSNILPGIPTLQLLSLDFRYSDSLNSPHIGDLRPLISIFKDPHILMHLRRITVTCCSTKWETPDVLVTFLRKTIAHWAQSDDTAPLLLPSGSLQSTAFMCIIFLPRCDKESVDWSADPIGSLAPIIRRHSSIEISVCGRDGQVLFPPES